MKDLKERLGELEQRISEVSGKLGDILNITADLQKKYDQSEQRRNQDETSRKKSEWLLFKITMILGSTSGVLTGLVVSYLMKFYDTFTIPSWIWLVSAIVLSSGYTAILVWVWKMERPPKL